MPMGIDIIGNGIALGLAVKYSCLYGDKIGSRDSTGPFVQIKKRHQDKKVKHHFI
jgi:hypothetical protein